ncbi:unnamed protein product [Lupinus luteus]|uniref:Uncharacterized protein n=1 Tax=Lupinus luteus TaxID=3873 RepID=A0AAV1Y106_LUPLU
MEFFIGSTQTKESLFLNPVQNGSGFQIAGPPKFFAGGSSESENSSTIGTPDDSDIEDEEDEVQSNFKEKTGLGSLDSLEDSLPIKRGLSSHFDGKTKSFTNLSQVSNLKELQKQESPFNKRRRVLIASKWSKKSSNFYTWSNPQSMPLLPMDESQDDDDYDYEDGEKKARKVPFTSSSSSSSSSSLVEEKKQEYQIHVCQDRLPESYAAEMRLRLKSFKSRSFSLADLKENDDGEEDNDG